MTRLGRPGPSGIRSRTGSGQFPRFSFLVSGKCWVWGGQAQAEFGHDGVSFRGFHSWRLVSVRFGEARPKRDSGLMSRLFGILSVIKSISKSCYNDNIGDSMTCFYGFSFFWGGTASYKKEPCRRWYDAFFGVQALGIFSHV
jgi:hypothetical protein